MSKLTMKQALRRAQSKFGKSALLEDKGRKLGPSSTELRNEAKAAYDAHKAAEPKLAKLEDWPPEATVAEYREAVARQKVSWAAWKKEADRIGWRTSYRRFQVGTVAENGLFLIVQGQGDSWEEALAFAGIVAKPNLAEVDS